ncbi:hypothetical protein SAMN05443245_7167 [Paraburkholderia fungorum]|uniref:Uncharacterized protein n=1 Tax=Paraburkholderia fungorum TaxID=134537 RepID=A0A1H1JQS4_9BURK|nr:hypothetical protein SAMN05443245_7167 [Paraburkholderia fungorum]
MTKRLARKGFQAFEQCPWNRSMILRLAAPEPRRTFQGTIPYSAIAVTGACRLCVSNVAEC